MATPKRPRATSSTPKTQKAAVAPAQETTTPQQSKSTTVPQNGASTNHGNGNSRVNVEDSIRYRAYQLYEQRGRRHGFDMEDWLRAEGEVHSSKGARPA